MTTQIIQDVIDGKARLTHMPAPFVTELRAQMLEHARQGRPGRALEYAQALLLASPESAHSWLLVGGMYRELGQLSMSLRCVEQAHVCDSMERTVRLSRGELWAELGRPREGLAEIKAVFLEGYRAELAPEDQDIVTLRAGAILEAVERLIQEMSPAPHVD